MYEQELKRHFRKAVAPLKVSVAATGESRWSRSALPDGFAVDVEGDGRDETFVLRLEQGAAQRWDFHVTNADPARRHLVLVARLTTDEGTTTRHFLCGHDERHLFVAGITSRVTTVTEAMESLKPPVVRASQESNAVKPKARNRRCNAAFIRQGEWFFVPRPEFQPEKPILVRHNEPIRRGRGKAHIVEYLYRAASGARVYVCSRYPNGISEQRYRALLKTKREAARWNWQMMALTTSVYAQGRVRHPDHATIVLPIWHLVVANAESGRNVAFLD